MNSLERLSLRASQEKDLNNRVSRIVALFCLALVIVLLAVQKQIASHQSSGGGATSGTGTIVQPQVRPGHPSSTRPEKPMTECERLDGNRVGGCR